MAFPGKYPGVTPTTLIAGATGFVGGRLADSLIRSGVQIRCIVRDPEKQRARELAAAGAEVHKGDFDDYASLVGAAEGIETAYYLVHAMSGGGDFGKREQANAHNFARLTKSEGVARAVYLGGLGEEAESDHLKSRQLTAQILNSEGPPLTYFRAAMVVGAGSESYRTLRYLVGRLPVMVAPSWLRTDTQPIGVEDTVEYLRRAPDVPESKGREVQIGGPDVLTYADMLDQMADALGISRRPKLPVPLISPSLSSHWIGLVTPVDANVARPLIEGLKTRTVVTDRSGSEPFGIETESLGAALRRAIDEEEAVET